LGLRARLLSAFALLCVVTAAAVAGGMYVVARNEILERTQNAAVEAMRDRLQALFPLRDPKPGPAELSEIVSTVAERNSDAIAVYHGTRSPAGPARPCLPFGRPCRQGLDLGMIPGELRRKVADGVIAWQRVVWEDGPYLIIGTPLLIVEGDRPIRASGIEVYVARSLASEQHAIDKLAVRAWGYGGVALAFAVVLALLATWSVLRPVREL
ncbi:two-component sensor histidine kinase, partial [Streptosporangium algeriense]